MSQPNVHELIDMPGAGTARGKCIEAGCWDQTKDPNMREWAVVVEVTTTETEIVRVHACSAYEAMSIAENDLGHLWPDADEVSAMSAQVTTKSGAVA